MKKNKIGKSMVAKMIVFVQIKNPPAGEKIGGGGV